MWNQIFSSHRVSLQDIPKPSVQLITLWPDVFPTEKVELGCRVEGSSVWRFTWYRNGSEIEAVGDGATLTIRDATAGHSGQYVCEGRHSSRSVTTNTSDGLTLQVYGESTVASGYDQQEGNGLCLNYCGLPPHITPTGNIMPHNDRDLFVLNSNHFILIYLN